jgi:hypothetical protein
LTLIEACSNMFTCTYSYIYQDVVRF